MREKHSNRKDSSFLGVVLDGRKGVREVFSDIPVQMCHFHQKQVLRRYLTLKQKLEAGQELLALGRILPFSKEDDFIQLLEKWFLRWEDFLKERTCADVGETFPLHTRRSDPRIAV
ncbi:MAG TPA: hypothetical protein VN420_01195 [Candidatus Fimivivens sp.]|nr:hypothetical protein [Candidatus Fimivivens sp.]